MSTKIYNGLRSTVSNPFDSANSIRAIIEPMFFQRFIETIPDTSSFQSLSNHYGAIQKSFESDTYNFDNPEVDFGYEVVVLPKRLVMVFSQHQEYRNALLTAGVVEDYGYWDNSDRPDEVTAAQWRARKKNWSIVFNKSPARAGLSFKHPCKIETFVEISKIIQKKHSGK